MSTQTKAPQSQSLNKSLTSTTKYISLKDLTKINNNTHIGKIILQKLPSTIQSSVNNAQNQNFQRQDSLEQQVHNVNSYFNININPYKDNEKENKEKPLNNISSSTIKSRNNQISQTNKISHISQLNHIGKDNININNKHSLNLTQSNSQFNSQLESQSKSYSNINQSQSQSQNQINNISLNNKSYSKSKIDMSLYHTQFKLKYTKLEKIIKEIKEDGFEKIRFEIEKANQIKNEVEKRVEDLQGHLNYYNSNFKKYGLKNLSFQQMTMKSMSIKDRLKLDSNYCSKQFDVLKSEISNSKRSIIELHEETNEIKLNINKEEEEIKSVKDGIKKVNLCIYSLNKEKENIYSQIKQVKNQISQLEGKILLQANCTNDFMKHVISFEKEAKKKIISRIGSKSVGRSRFIMKDKGKI